VSDLPVTRILDTPPLVDVEAARIRIGLIALATDLTSELDFARICTPKNIAVHTTRVAYQNPTNAANLTAMQPELGRAAALIAPGISLDAIAYACTAASVLIGDDAVAAAIRAARPDTPCVTPIGAAIAGLRALEARRIAILTPYTPDVAQTVVEFVAQHGFAVTASGCFGFDDDRRMAQIDPDRLAAAAAVFCGDDADALFISCTALRACEVADTIEKQIGRPVVTANQAMIWASLRAAGISEPIESYGRLMRLPLHAPA
jgi:maleate isomerase